MLKKDLTGLRDCTPPALPETRPELSLVSGGEAANEGAWNRAAGQARRQRRLRRAARSRGRVEGGWTLALW